MHTSDVILYLIAVVVATLGAIDLARLIVRALLFVSRELRTGLLQLGREIDREKVAWRRLLTRAR